MVEQVRPAEMIGTEPAPEPGYHISTLAQQRSRERLERISQPPQALIAEKAAITSR